MLRQLRLTLVGGFVLILASALVSAQDGKKGEKDAKAPNYYPLEVGNAWTFRVNVNGKDSNITTLVAKHEKIDGELLARLESPNVALTEHLTQNAKGVFRHRFKGAEVTPPFKLLAYPMKIGAKWEGEFTVVGEEGKHAYKCEVLKEEAVEVPAGKFKAMVVQVKLDTGGQKIDTTYWFVQDVGFVKQVAILGPVTINLELERLERKK